MELEYRVVERFETLVARRSLAGRFDAKVEGQGLADLLALDGPRVSAGAATPGAEDVQDRAPRAEGPRPPTPASPWPWALAVGAAALVLVGGGYWWSRSSAPAARCGPRSTLDRLSLARLSVAGAIQHLSLLEPEQVLRLGATTHAEPWPPLTRSEVFRRLGCADGGLSAADAEERFARYGRNQLEGGKRKSFLGVLVRQFNLLQPSSCAANWMLVCAGASCLALHEYVDGAVLLAVVALSALVSAIAETRADEASSAMEDQQATKARVRRGGRDADVPASELVPGDVLLLSAGDTVPADCRILEHTDCQAMEMVLTGESREVKKRADAVEADGPSPNMLYAQTDVVLGRATAVVVATSMDTRVGSIAQQLSAAGGASALAESSLGGPMQRSLNTLSAQLMAICVLAFFTTLLVCGLTEYEDPDAPCDPRLARQHCVWSKAFQTALFIAVKVVPMMLIPVLTLSLWYGCQVMKERQAVVRQLGAVSSLGSCSVICSDKTGTFTEGRMAWVGLFALTPEPSQWDFDGAPFAAHDYVRFCGTVTSLNCRGVSVRHDEPGQEPLVSGNLTEVPIVRALLESGQTLEAVQQSSPLLAEVPFSSSRKLSVTVHEVSPSLGLAASHLLIVKGAPDQVLQHLSGSVVPDDTGRWRCEPCAGVAAHVRARNAELAASALRVLLVAVRPLKAPEAQALQALEADEVIDRALQDLCLLGLFCIRDPPRPGVREAVESCRTAGIRVVMVTGDQLATARAIGREVGVGGEGELAGSLRDSAGELWPAEQVAALAASVDVWARAQPEDKIAIVEALQNQDQDCAMTGDGVNDAPALRQADVGVAMGSGSQVARGASSLVLQDDNFVTIVDAVRCGRQIFANIAHIVVFWISINVAELVANTIILIRQLPKPFESLNMIVLQFATTTLGVLPLILEPAEPDVMHLKPRSPHASLVHPMVWLFVAVPIWVCMPLVLLLTMHFGLLHHVGVSSNPEIASLCEYAWTETPSGLVRDPQPFYCQCRSSALETAACKSAEGCWKQEEDADQWGRTQTPENNFEAAFDASSGFAGSAYAKALGPFAAFDLHDPAASGRSSSLDGTPPLKRCRSDPQKFCWTQQYLASGPRVGPDGKEAGEGPLHENLWLDAERNCARYGTRCAKTMAWMATLVSEVLFLQTNRSARGLFTRDVLLRNKVAVSFGLGSLIICILGIYVPGLNWVLKLAPLGGYSFLIACIGPFATLIVCEVCKWPLRDRLQQLRVTAPAPKAI